MEEEEEERVGEDERMRRGGTVGGAYVERRERGEGSAPLSMHIYV